MSDIISENAWITEPTPVFKVTVVVMNVAGRKYTIERPITAATMQQAIDQVEAWPQTVQVLKAEYLYHINP